MNSKESVKELYKEREYLLGEKVNNKTKNWHNDITHYDNINHCLLTINQDLDRLEKLEKEYQDLKEWCLILNRHLYIAPEMCELRMATPKNADFLIKNSSWTKYYNGIDVHEIDYKKFVDLYYSKIKEVKENDR